MLDSIFTSGKHRESGFEKVDLIVHGKMSGSIGKKGNTIFRILFN